MTTAIGKYQIIDKIGEGAMGVVYRAMDPVLNRPVAVKIMSEGLAQDEVLRERFLREAQAAGSLQHPNLVTIYDFGEIDGHLFIAMEFIRGVDLEYLLRNGPSLPLTAKLDIVIDVLNGLAYAHRRGIIHRDIKPANIRVDEDGHARIMDFGVAHLGASNLTTTGVMVGTPNYMAPEQISGDPITPSVDIFSVGAMLYELLTNAKPFEGDTLHNVLFKIVSDTPPDVSSINPECPVELTEVVKKALAKTPQQRWKGAAEMANALMAVRAKLGAPRTSKTVSQRVSIDASLRKQQAVATTLAEGSRKNAALVAGGALAAVVLLGVGFMLARGLTQSSAPTAVHADTSTQTALPALATPQVVAAPAAAASQSSGDSTRAKTAASVMSGTPARDRASTAGAGRTAARLAEAPASRRTKLPATVASTPDTQAAALQSAPPVLPVPTPPITTPAPAISAPPPTQSPPAVAPAPLENPREGVTIAVAEYARAIGSRDVSEIRRVYPRITTLQESNWKTFFSAVRSINAGFDITSLDVNGATATAQLTGAYHYVTTAGRNEHRPITVRATLQKESGVWKIQRVE